MICILSDSGIEITTDHVMQWLRSWGLPCFRLNSEDLYGYGEETVSIWLDRQGCRGRLRIGGQEIDPEAVKTVWYRRWPLTNGLRTHDLFHPQPGTVPSNNRTLLTHALGDISRTSEVLLRLFRNANWLGSPLEASLNKLLVLQEALECGLDIPETVVANHKQALLDFLDRKPNSITKAISETFILFVNERGYAPFTAGIQREHLDRYQENMFPSLLQERLEKEYEIRSFFLDGEFYSMAVFSQSREQTKTDFRVYQWDNPARTVPYQLPSAIERRLRELMRRLNLDTGSIDLIFTPDGRFVFLEVNPVGQFGMVSMPCNYYLEKKVALALKQRYENACSVDVAAEGANFRERDDNSGDRRLSRGVFRADRPGRDARRHPTNGNRDRVAEPAISE